MNHTGQKTYRYKPRSPCDHIRTKLLCLSPEATVEEYYDITAELGRGGFSKVYKALPRNDPSQEVAIKIIYKDSELIELNPAALANEISALTAAKDHPNIMACLSCWETPSRLYIITERLGPPLCSDQAKDVPSYSKPQIKSFARQILSALDHIHSLGIIHRDIKPESFLFSLEGDGKTHIKMIDFGLSETEKKIGSASVWAGTPEYQAPEVVSLSPCNSKVDIWGAGALLFVLNFRALPFYDPNNNSMLIHLNIRNRTFNPNVTMPEDCLVTQFIKLLLSQEPCARPTAADALQHQWIKQN